MNTHYDVIIFGGSSGIGLASALLFKSQNLSVLSISRNAELKTQLRDAKIDAINCNITSQTAIKELFTKLQSVKHIVLTVSSEMYFESINNLNIDKAKEVYDKVWHYISIIQESLNHFDDLESITLISGAIADTNAPDTIALKLLASSTNQIAKTLAVEIAPIRINAVAPGITNTPLFDAFDNKEQMINDFANGTPLKRVAQPKEIAEAISFVTLNKNMTGAIINIDGGAVL